MTTLNPGTSLLATPNALLGGTTGVAPPPLTKPVTNPKVPPASRGVSERRSPTTRETNFVGSGSKPALIAQTAVGTAAKAGVVFLEEAVEAPIARMVEKEIVKRLIQGELGRLSETSMKRVVASVSSNVIDSLSVTQLRDPHLVMSLFYSAVVPGTSARLGTLAIQSGVGLAQVAAGLVALRETNTKIEAGQGFLEKVVDFITGTEKTGDLESQNAAYRRALNEFSKAEQDLKRSWSAPGSGGTAPSPSADTASPTSSDNYPPVNSTQLPDVPIEPRVDPAEAKAQAEFGTTLNQARATNGELVTAQQNYQSAYARAQGKIADFYWVTTGGAAALPKLHQKLHAVQEAVQALRNIYQSANAPVSNLKGLERQLASILSGPGGYNLPGEASRAQSDVFGWQMNGDSWRNNVSYRIDDMSRWLGSAWTYVSDLTRAGKGGTSDLPPMIPSQPAYADKGVAQAHNTASQTQDKAQQARFNAPVVPVLPAVSKTPAASTTSSSTPGAAAGLPTAPITSGAPVGAKTPFNTPEQVGWYNPSTQQFSASQSGTSGVPVMFSVVDKLPVGARRMHVTLGDGVGVPGQQTKPGAQNVDLSIEQEGGKLVITLEEPRGPGDPKDPKGRRTGGNDNEPPERKNWWQKHGGKVRICVEVFGTVGLGMFLYGQQDANTNPRLDFTGVNAINNKLIEGVATGAAQPVGTMVRSQIWDNYLSSASTQLRDVRAWTQMPRFSSEELKQFDTAVVKFKEGLSSESALSPTDRSSAQQSVSFSPGFSYSDVKQQEALTAIVNMVNDQARNDVRRLAMKVFGSPDVTPTFSPKTHTAAEVLEQYPEIKDANSAKSKTALEAAEKHVWRQFLAEVPSAMSFTPQQKTMYSSNLGQWLSSNANFERAGQRLEPEAVNFSPGMALGDATKGSLLRDFIEAAQAKARGVVNELRKQAASGRRIEPQNGSSPTVPGQAKGATTLRELLGLPTSRPKSEPSTSPTNDAKARRDQIEVTEFKAKTDQLIQGMCDAINKLQRPGQPVVTLSNFSSYAVEKSRFVSPGDEQSSSALYETNTRLVALIKNFEIQFGKVGELSRAVTVPGAGDRPVGSEVGNLNLVTIPKIQSIRVELITLQADIVRQINALPAPR